MSRRFGFGSLASLALIGGLASNAHAAPALRVQVDQRGDFVLLGNALGYECSNPVAPIVGTVGACGTAATLTDSAPDIYWRADSPMAGQAEANTGITAANARTTAMLVIPAGATITHAYLYWGAGAFAAPPDTLVTLDREGGFSADVTSIQSFASGNPSRYQSVADVTSIVQANGPGAYRVGGVDGPPLVSVNNSNNFAAWWMVVFYQLASDPVRNLALFDGLDPVATGLSADATLSGFLVPNAGFDAKLGVVAYEGDPSTGDQMTFNGAVLSNALNPASNFFNGTRSTLGVPVHFPGDLPEMPGTATSMQSIDIDVIDVTANLTAGQTSAPIQATTSSDVLFLAGFVTSISTVKPDFGGATKTAMDLNGGLVLPGDTIEYTISAGNAGNDAAINVVMTDVIPAGVTYVPGSLQITQGANAGAKTDMSADDQGDYDTTTKTVTVRLGAGANATMGGTMALNEATTVVFRVTVDANAAGPIKNQAKINAAGQLGASATDTPTDGNGAGAGSPPTQIMVVGCETDAQCSAPTPHCDTSNECVQCVMDAQCSGLTPTCDPTLSTCVCVSSGPETCDGKDNDCNGQLDEGFNLGTACMAGVGECQSSGMIACDGMGASACTAVAGMPSAEKCDGKDNDCDGTADNGFNLGMACTGGVGECQASGVLVCDGMGAAACDAVVGMPAAETCDGKDNDCDGIADNGFDLGMACMAGVGECQASGVRVCDGMGAAVCDAVAGMPATEKCADGKDNDCDGEVDEDCSTAECTKDSDCGSPGSGKICDLTTPAKCVTGCHTVDDCPAGQVCSATDARPGECTMPSDHIVVAGGGCDCSVQPSEQPYAPSIGLVSLGAALALARRRRRKAPAQKRD